MEENVTMHTPQEVRVIPGDPAVIVTCPICQDTHVNDGSQCGKG